MKKASFQTSKGALNVKKRVGKYAKTLAKKHTTETI